MQIPAVVVEGLGSSKRPLVKVTINRHTYRSAIAVMGGVFMLGVSAENRAAAGVAAGQDVDVDIELDTEPREVPVPADFAKALTPDFPPRGPSRRAAVVADIHATLDFQANQWQGL